MDPIDRTLSVMQAQTLDGKPIVTLVNFQCHGRFWGRRIARLRGLDGYHAQKCGAVVWGSRMYLQGATGDLNPDHEWGEEDFSAVETIGMRIADRVRQVLPLMAPISAESVSFHQQQVWLSLEAEAHGLNPPPIYREVLAKMAHVPRFLVDFVLNQRYPWKTLIHRSDGFWSVPVVLTHLRVGDLALYALGAEVFTRNWHGDQGASPTSHTFFASVSNGCIGYFPPRKSTHWRI